MSRGLTARYKQLLASLHRASDRPIGKPKISIITPTWNTEPSFLIELAQSMIEQTCTEWEWCIVDDHSSRTEFQELFPELQRMKCIKILQLLRQGGISRATNAGLAIASAPYVCCVDHDDTLTFDALESMLTGHEAGFDAVYSDSDKINDNGDYEEPFFKPDWSPEFFRGVMYVGHLLSFRRDLALNLGGFDSDFDGIQDFEFFLRYSEVSQRITHLSKILYHWRKASGSIAAQTDAKGDVNRLQMKAVQAHLHRLEMPASAIPGSFAHRVRVLPRKRLDSPKVSVIIPTRDSPQLLSQCLHSIFSKTRYGALEVLCVDNETSNVEALEEMRVAPVKRVIFPGKFNFSAANNLGRRYATGQYLVFLNNDVEVITEDWIEQMLYYAEQPDVGAVGPMLLYPDGSIQHAGVVLGCRGTADHVGRRFPADCDGYAGSLSCAHEVSAVTAACLMISTEKFDLVSGFNPYFATIYQDVDLCLKLRAKKLRNIFTPHARLYHHESASRGNYYDFVDRNLLLDFWEPIIQEGDPYYNRQFNLQTLDYSLVSH